MRLSILQKWVIQRSDVFIWENIARKIEFELLSVN